MNLKVECCYDSEQNFDDLELYLVISLGHTVANGFNNRIYEFSGQTSIHI